MKDIELEIERIRLERELKDDKFVREFKVWKDKMKAKLEDKWDAPTIRTYNNPSNNTTLNKNFNEAMLMLKIEKLEKEVELLKLKLLNYG